MFVLALKLVTLHCGYSFFSFFLALQAEILLQLGFELKYCEIQDFAILRPHSVLLDYEALFFFTKTSLANLIWGMLKLQC